MIEAFFFIAGAIFGSVIAIVSRKNQEEAGEPVRIPFMPQRVKPPVYTPLWHKPESGEVVMPDRADVIKRDNLKIDDLLQ